MFTRRLIRMMLVVEAVVLICLPAPGQAADLKEGVEQLAVLLGKSVPDGRVLRVAVTDFPDLQGVNSDLSRYIAERLTTRLSGQTQKFRIIERRRLNLVLGELKFSMSDLVDPSKAKQLGRMLGVEGLVVGSIADLGNQVDVDARIIEIETNNILPGVSTTLSKDQVVTQLLSQGRQGTPVLSPGTPLSGPPGPLVAAAPQRAGAYPVNQKFMSGSYTMTPDVVLFNVEVAEGRFLKFNFSIGWPHQYPGIMEAYLDNPQESAFLIDQLGRQHPLVQATGISAGQPIKLPPQSSRRFALIFPLPADMESFKYQAIVLTRVDNHENRLQMRSDKAINLSDFR